MFEREGQKTAPRPLALSTWLILEIFWLTSKMFEGEGQKTAPHLLDSNIYDWFYRFSDLLVECLRGRSSPLHWNYVLFIRAAEEFENVLNSLALRWKVFVSRRNFLKIAHQKWNLFQLVRYLSSYFNLELFRLLCFSFLCLLVVSLTSFQLWNASVKNNRVWVISLSYNCGVLYSRSGIQDNFLYLHFNLIDCFVKLL